MLSKSKHVKIYIVGLVLSVCFIILNTSSNAQTFKVSGFVSSNGKIIEAATIKVNNNSMGTVSDSTGYFNLNFL